MFLNKWTVQLDCPGQIVEKSFDSEEEILAFVRGMENDSADGVRPSVRVIDPGGNQKLITHLAAHELSEGTARRHIFS